MKRLARPRIRIVVLGTMIITGALIGPLPAQKRVSSEKQALPELGNKPSAVLKIENLKGTVKKVDLTKRAVTVAHSDGETEFTFPTAAGREKISLSKKVARALGKKSLRLEEMPAGSQVKVAYYPALGSIMEITIEEMGR